MSDCDMPAVSKILDAVNAAYGLAGLRAVAAFAFHCGPDALLLQPFDDGSQATYPMDFVLQQCWAMGAKPVDLAPPFRFQISRKKGWRMPPNAIKVDRTTVWGNPYYDGGPLMWNAREDDGTLRPMPLTPENCVRAHREYLENLRANNVRVFQNWIAPLRGKNLGCWCPIGNPCHAETLLEFANR